MQPADKHLKLGQRPAIFALLIMAACWGSSFPLTKVMLHSLSTQDYLALRFTAAAGIMGSILPRRIRRLDRTTLWRSICLGGLYGCAQLMQVLGLRTTPASESGFIIGLSVVITPVLGFAVLRQTTSGRTWCGVGLSFAGLALLSLSSVNVGLGQVLTVLSATLYATHVVAVSRWIRRGNALGSSVVQLAGCALVCCLAEVGDRVVLPHTATAWVTLAYLSIVVAGVALVLQVWAQARLSANRSALAMSTEPVWACALAVGFLHERLTLRMSLGAIAMLAGVLVVELSYGRSHTESEPESVERNQASAAGRSATKYRADQRSPRTGLAPIVDTHHPPA